MQSVTDLLAVDSVAVTDQTSRCRALAKGFRHLHRNPCRCRVIGNIEMQHLPTAVLQNKENE